MKTIFLLFSHQLQQKQLEELREVWHVESEIHMPQELQQQWSNISPDAKSLQETLEPFRSFLDQNANEGDMVLIQGDFGACYTMVNFAKSLGLTAVYATTKRNAIEEMVDGKLIKRSVFEHRRFREYGN